MATETSPIAVSRLPAERHRGRCFVISPIGAKGSEVQRHSEAVFQKIIKPAMDECGLEVSRSDKIAKPGRISDEMYKRILYDRLCIAVLTGQNPNVYYELAVAQAAGRPVILLIAEGEELPFDVQDHRCIRYRYDTNAFEFEHGVYAEEVAKQVRELEADYWRTTIPFGQGLEPLGGRGDVRVSTEPPGGRTLVGIDIGRSNTSYGVTIVTADSLSKLPKLDDCSAQEQRRLYVAIDSHDFYERLADAIARLDTVAGGEEGVLDGIGVGVPGQVNPPEGSVTASPRGFKSHEHFVDKLAGAMGRRDDLRRAFGFGSAEANEVVARAIGKRILIDNDVRCATRHIQSKFIDNPRWRNFACIFVGSGLGTGLVLEGVPYYGTAGSAGEAGHMTIHLSPEQASHVGISDSSEGLPFHPQTCACHRHGVHWEAVTNGTALAELARQTDDACAERLASAFAEDGDAGASLPLQEQIGIAASALDPSATPEYLERLVPARVREAIEDPKMNEFLSVVVERYTYLFAVGVANLTNLLNLDHIALGGGVMDGLAPLPLFRRKWEHVLDRYLLQTPCSTLRYHFYHDDGARVDYGTDKPGWAWQGSALLFWDASYHTFRERFAATC